VSEPTRTTRSSSRTSVPDIQPSEPSLISQLIDRNIQREFDALTPSEQVDFNNFRFDLPGLPLRENRIPVRSDRVEELDVEGDQQLGGSQLPDSQPLSLQEKMIEAAARRTIQVMDLLAYKPFAETNPSI
jgi:hypothetical protein